MWQKSSYCKTDSPMCVLVDGLETDEVFVKDSKVGGTFAKFVLHFSREEWQTFIDGVKAGEFDLRTDNKADAEEMMEQV